MLQVYLIASTITFIAAFCAWSKKSWLDTSIKIILLFLAIMGVLVCFGVTSLHLPS